MKNIDKTKLVLHTQSTARIADKPLETKEIGYYQDSWNRFKKNKASYIAFIIICIVMFFVMFGPIMKNYDLPQRDKEQSMRLDTLTPKIPILEEFGIFDGSKTITVGKRFAVAMANHEYGKKAVISGIPEDLLNMSDEALNDFLFNKNFGTYQSITSFKVKVDFYVYKNYITSYMPSNYFSTLDENIKNGTNNDPRAGIISTIQNKEQFDDYLAKNYILEVISISQSSTSDQVTYRVIYDQFAVSLNQTPEDTYFWFGTTVRGEDLFTEIWKGARISLIMAISVLAINYTIGLIIGSIVGYYGGVLDLLFDRVVEILLSIPFLSVLMLLVLSFGTKMWVVVLAFTATGWIGPYSTGRLQFYRFKNREYVLAARTLGASDWRIMFKHIFPNTLGLIITGMALAVPQFVFTESTYAFLNIIQYENAISIGMLINEGQAAMHSNPHLIIFPAIYIAILMISFNLFGNGLRDAFNPSLRGVE